MSSVGKKQVDAGEERDNAQSRWIPWPLLPMEPPRGGNLKKSGKQGRDHQARQHRHQHFNCQRHDGISILCPPPVRDESAWVRDPPGGATTRGGAQGGSAPARGGA